MEKFLPARQPFNFLSVIQSHGWYQLAPMTWDAERRVLTKIEELESGGVVALNFRGERRGVRVEVKGRVANHRAREIEAKAKRMFMLDADLSEFYAVADNEPRLAHARARANGRYLRSTTLFEDVVKVMMTTNILWGGTKRLVANLVHHFGAPLEANPALRAFPAPEKIARSREATLRKLGIGYRSPYLLHLARGVVAGKYDLDGLSDASAPTEEIRARLIELPGIGPYAAATLLGILGRYDFIGVDTEAVSLVSKGFYGGKPVGAKEIDAAFARFGKYKMLAYWFWDWEGQQQSPMEMWEAKQKK